MRLLRLSRLVVSGLAALAALAGPSIGGAAATAAQAGTAAPVPVPVPVPGLNILRAEFGLFNGPGSDKPAFVPSTVVPHVPDQAYGWLIVINTSQPRLRVREELTLPSPPKTWGDPDPAVKRMISADGRTAISELVLEPTRGLIFQSWTIAPGDPKGRHVLKVRVEDLAEKVFTFEVQ